MQSAGKGKTIIFFRIIVSRVCICPRIIFIKEKNQIERKLDIRKKRIRVNMNFFEK